MVNKSLFYLELPFEHNNLVAPFFMAAITYNILPAYSMWARFFVSANNRFIHSFEHAQYDIRAVYLFRMNEKLFGQIDTSEFKWWYFEKKQTILRHYIDYSCLFSPSNTNREWYPYTGYSCRWTVDDIKDEWLRSLYSDRYKPDRITTFTIEPLNFNEYFLVACKETNLIYQNLSLEDPFIYSTYANWFGFSYKSIIIDFVSTII